MKKNLFSVIALLFLLNGFSQSPRQVVIEHFTNTKCSICASRNPGFYAVLSNYPQAIHIAYHPSSPYSQCFFSLQNPTENDGRTYYYNTFGSTPDYFLNGKKIPDANPAITTTTIDTALNQFSPMEVFAYEEVIGLDSVQVRVVVRTTGTTSLTTVKLFVAVAEEPINYTGSNGESVHHDVFRKALTAVAGNLFSLPALNDSVEFNFRYKVQSGWSLNNLHSLAIVQRSDTKEIVNANNSVRITSTPLSVMENVAERFTVSPNPFTDKLVIKFSFPYTSTVVEVMDITGRKVAEFIPTSETNHLETTRWNPGIYLLKVGGEIKKMVKQ